MCGLALRRSAEQPGAEDRGRSEQNCTAVVPSKTAVRSSAAAAGTCRKGRKARQEPMRGRDVRLQIEERCDAAFRIVAPFLFWLVPGCEPNALPPLQEICPQKKNGMERIIYNCHTIWVYGVLQNLRGRNRQKVESQVQGNLWMRIKRYPLGSQPEHKTTTMSNLNGYIKRVLSDKGSPFIFLRRNAYVCL